MKSRRVSYPHPAPAPRSLIFLSPPPLLSPLIRLQVLYMVAVGSFPFNSFLAGLFCSGGFFVLTASLRMQLTPANKGEFPGLTLERAVADYAVAAMLLFFVTWNFMG